MQVMDIYDFLSKPKLNHNATSNLTEVWFKLELPGGSHDFLNISIIGPKIFKTSITIITAKTLTTTKQTKQKASMARCTLRNKTWSSVSVSSVTTLT